MSYHSSWSNASFTAFSLSTSSAHPQATSTTGETWNPRHCFLEESLNDCCRIWAAIKREALLTVAEGVASPAEVDAIFKEVLKTPKGPCEQMDVVGLDVVLDIEEHYAKKRDGLPTKPRELLRDMIAEGKLGVKNGTGFYSYV